MTNTKKVNRPATAQLLVLDDLLDVYKAARDNECFAAWHFSAGLLSQLRFGLMVAFDFNEEVVVEVLAHLEDRPASNVIDAVDEALAPRA